MARLLSMPRLTVAIAATLALSGAVHAAANDPLEGLNRKVFAFNEFFDEWVGQPVAKFYRDWVPQPVRTGASNVFSNIGDVFSIANNLLQAKPRAALEDTYRVVLNTTLGIGGIFDLATDAGIDKHGEDFGQTLGVWGVGPGPYLVLPFFGPSSLRDATGTAVHAYWDPVFYLNDIPVRNTVIGWRFVDQRALLLGAGRRVKFAFCAAHAANGLNHDEIPAQNLPGADVGLCADVDRRGGERRRGSGPDDPGGL